VQLCDSAYDKNVLIITSNLFKVYKTITTRVLVWWILCH